MTKPDDRFTEAEARDYVEWQVEQPRGAPPGSQNGHHPDHDPSYSLDDKGNGQRFADRFGADYRYNHTTKQYHSWDGVRWKVDDKNHAQEDAKRIAEDVFRDALDYADGTPERKAWMGWAKASGMGLHIAQTLKQASSIPPIAKVATDFDADAVLLAFPNGYLNLKTGAFTPPTREALVTKVCAAPYDADARSDLWDGTLARFLPDEDKRRDLQTAVGYNLSGRGKEHMFLPYGGTKRGKSTILSAIANALGDYAVTVGMETFTASHYAQGGGTREDLVALVGKRLVVASEATENQRLNPAVLKRVLGGSDKMSLRALYGKQFEALPTFALWLLTNHQPKLPADDEAIWERMHVFPFDQYIPPEERDETERDKVTNPAITGSAILAWALEGWWRFTREQHGRLSLPTTAEATRAYQQDQDAIARFIGEYCVEGRSKWCAFSDFKTTFRSWLKEEGIHDEYSDTRIGRALTARTYTIVTHPTLKMKCRLGVALKDTEGDTGLSPWV